MMTNTPWGPLRVCDAHVHFFSHRFFEMLLAQRGGGNVEDLEKELGWRMPPRDPAHFAGQWGRELDRRGVARAALIASLPADEASVAAAVEAYPERFYGYSLMNPLLEGAMIVTRHGLDAWDLSGICLFPAMHHYSIRDPRLLPFFELAAERPGVLVFVHCGVLSVGVRKRLGLPSLFDMSYSNPIDIHPLAMRFPNLPFVVPHFGAGYFREALMLCDLCPNVYLDTSSSNNWMRYQEEGCTLESVFRRALAVAGPRRLLFGTDSSYFPRGWNAAIFESQASALHRIGVSAADAQAIFGGNLERLLAAG